MSDERLTLRKTLRDGRVLALNTWNTGWQELVYANRASFDIAKKQVEDQGIIPEPRGFTPISH